MERHPGADAIGELKITRWFDGEVRWVGLSGEIDMVSVAGALHVLCDACTGSWVVINVSGLRSVDARAADVLRGAWALLAGRSNRFDVIDPANVLAAPSAFD